MQYNRISARSPPRQAQPLPRHIESTPNFEGENL